MSAVDQARFTKVQLGARDDPATAAVIALVADVLCFVCRRHDTDAAELLSTRRSDTLTRARSMAVWLIRHLRPGVSYPVIGRLLARDHSTIMESHARSWRMRIDDPEFRAACDAFLAIRKREGMIDACD